MVLSCFRNFHSSLVRRCCWNYDANRGWLASKRYADAATGLPGNLGPDYEYWSSWRLKTRQWARTNDTARLSTSYSYNNAGDLSGIDYSDGTPDVAYTYDRLGRRIAVSQQGTTTSTASMAYDGAGNLLSEAYTGGPLDGLIMTNIYDAYLRRTGLGLSNYAATASGYAYDAASRLRLASAGDVNAGYLFIM